MVKCARCPRPAVIKIRYSKMHLCDHHFSEYLVERVKRTMERYDMVGRGDEILIAASGGKDSASLVHMLADLSHEMEYSVIGLHIDLGIGDYSERCSAKAVKLFEEVNIPYIVLDLRRILGHGIPELSRKVRRKACSLCGIIKRYLMNLTANACRASKIATGHTMEDLAQYIIKAFLLQDQEQLSRLKPVTKGRNGLIGRIKPLCEITERETFTYAYVNHLPFTYEECPMFRERTLDAEIRSFIKRMQYERPSIVISLIRRQSEVLADRSAKNLIKCAYCGMPSSTSPCAFCKILIKLGREPEDVINRVYEIAEQMSR